MLRVQWKDIDLKYKTMTLQQTMAKYHKQRCIETNCIAGFALLKR
jgi:hypothetical protein